MSVSLQRPKKKEIEMGLQPQPHSSDDDISASIEALRSKHAAAGSKHSRIGGARPGSGKVSSLRKAASTAALFTAPPALPDPAQLQKTAVDSVQAGLIKSLDRDCRAYRTEITKLQQQLASQGEAATANVSAAAIHDAYTAQLNELQAQVDAAHTQREDLLATVARLSREKGTPMEQLAETEAQLVKARADATNLRTELDESRRQLADARKSLADADAAAGKQLQRMAQLEHQLNEGRQLQERWSQREATLVAELEATCAAKEEIKRELTTSQEEAHKLQAQVERASLEAAEAKGESSSLARRLAGMAERRDEREKKAGKADAEEAERRKLAEAEAARRAKEATGLRAELGGLKGEVSSSKAEATRANELVRTLRQKMQEAAGALKPELEEREKEAAKARKLADKFEKRAMQAEQERSELHAEVLRLRTAIEEARAEVEEARALADEQRRSAAGLRGAPKESLASLGDKTQSSFGKFQHKITALEAECAKLRAQLAQLQQSPKVRSELLQLASIKR